MGTHTYSQVAAAGVGKADSFPEPSFEEEALGGGNGGVWQKGILGDDLVPLLHLLPAERVGIAGACLHVLRRQGRDTQGQSQNRAT